MWVLKQYMYYKKKKILLENVASIVTDKGHMIGLTLVFSCVFSKYLPFLNSGCVVEAWNFSTFILNMFKAFAKNSMKIYDLFVRAKLIRFNKHCTKNKVFH